MQSTGSSVSDCSGAVLAEGVGEVVVEVVMGVDVVVVGWVVDVGEAVGLAVLEVAVALASLVLEVVDVLEVLDVVDPLDVLELLDEAVVEVEELLLSESGVVELHAGSASPPAAMAVTAMVLKRLFIFPPVVTTLSVTEAKPGGSSGW